MGNKQGGRLRKVSMLRSSIYFEIQFEIPCPTGTSNQEVSKTLRLKKKGGGRTLCNNEVPVFITSLNRSQRNQPHKNQILKLLKTHAQISFI